MLFTRKTLLDLPEDEHIYTQRRRLLRGMAGGVVAMAAPGLANAARVVPSKQRALSFVHTHTGEEVSLVYKVGERFLPRSMASIAHLMRDFRSGDVHPIDPQLLDVLWKMQHSLKNSNPFEIISAYRSPKTNMMLRNRTAHSGVAEKSMHLTGQAIDIRLPGSSLSDVRDAAKELKRGGAGYYSASDFVHVDTGKVPAW